jgi:transcriptional regulator with XRE-family HTH domain
MILSELLSTCREMKGLSLRDVAEQTGLSNPFISQLETGKVELSLRNAVALAKCYGITLDRMAKALPAKKKRILP